MRKNNIIDICDMTIKSIAKAELGMSKLDDEILNFEKTWAAPKVRHFLNNLCSYENVVYLECGIARGSSLLSALYDNDIEAYACDLWLESKLGKEAYEKFVSNYNNFKDKITPEKVRIINGDCWDLTKNDVDIKPNIFYYDAGHSVDDHRKAFTHFLPLLDDVFILIVDDVCDGRVREGTQMGISEFVSKNLGSIIWGITLPAFPSNSPYWEEGDKKPERFSDLDRWGNGFSIYIISQNR